MATQPPATAPLEKYGPPTEIGPNIFCVDGEWKGTAFKRRMTLIRLADASLVVHSAIRMSEDDMNKLDTLGTVKHVVVPNIFHGSDVGFYANRYPAAALYVPGSQLKKFQKNWTHAKSLKETLPFQNELSVVTLNKSLVDESALVHHASKTLVLCDLAFNMRREDFKSPVERFIMCRCNGLGHGLGPSNLTKLIAARDKESVRTFLSELSHHPFERVVVNHGSIVENNGKAQLFESFRKLYGDSILPT